MLGWIAVLGIATLLWQVDEFRIPMMIGLLICVPAGLTLGAQAGTDVLAFFAGLAVLGLVFAFLGPILIFIAGMSLAFLIICMILAAASHV